MSYIYLLVYKTNIKRLSYNSVGNQIDIEYLLYENIDFSKRKVTLLH